MIAMRTCSGAVDFPAISDFLCSHFQPNNRDGNWLQPIWEYAYTHPFFDQRSIQRIGIWEDAGTMVGISLYESRIGEAFFQIHPGYTQLKSEMLEYAERSLFGQSVEGRCYLKAYVNDFDTEFESLVRSRGYDQEPRCHRPMMQFAIRDPFPPIRMPEGFSLKSLADDNDLIKVDRVLRRGFNHPGEPSAESLEGRKKMQSGPNFRKDLAIVIEDSVDNFVAYAGLWFEPTNRYGLVEPVATDPDYRGMGLATAAVLEGIRRCGELGATVAYVGSDLPFYQSLGFKELSTLNCWIRLF